MKRAQSSAPPPALGLAALAAALTCCGPVQRPDGGSGLLEIDEPAGRWANGA